MQNESVATILEVKFRFAETAKGSVATLLVIAIQDLSWNL